MFAGGRWGHGDFCVGIMPYIRLRLSSGDGRLSSRRLSNSRKEGRAGPLRSQQYTLRTVLLGMVQA